MSNPLPSYRAKLGQARRHLLLLHQMEGYLQGGKAYQTFTESDPDTGKITVYGEPRRRSPAPEWGVVIGDVVHNLRSALDHLVWQLTLAEGHKPPPMMLQRKRRGSGEGSQITRRIDYILGLIFMRWLVASSPSVS